MKRLDLLALSILLLISPFISLQAVSASTYPQILAIDRAPLNPTPDFDVCISVKVIDRYGQIENSSVYYAINSSSTFNEINAKIVDGDYQNGTFIAQIPKQPEGTTISYYVIVMDSIGYISQSLNYSYVVSVDRTPPNIIEVKRLTPVGSPVLPTENVTVNAVVLDDGSGIKNVTLHYGIGLDPFDMPYEEMLMARVGTTNDYTGTIPLFPNGTHVHYYVSAFDKANNSVDWNTRDHYFVILPSQSSLQVYLDIKQIYMENRSATIQISIQGRLPSYEERPLIVDIDSTTSPFHYYVEINASSNSDRFWYSSIGLYDFYLSGDPSCYPYDVYSLSLNLTVYWSEPELFKTSTYMSQPLYNNTWHWNSTADIMKDRFSKTATFEGYPLVVSNLIIWRNTAGDVLPLILVIIILFFLLGGTLLLDTSKLNERLAVVLAIFIFMAGFYFTQSSTVPIRMGLTIAERLLLSLVGGSAFIAISSLLSASIRHYTKNLRSFSNIMIWLGLLIDGFSVFIFTQYWLLPLLSDIPVAQHSNLILIGVFYGLAVRAIICMLQSGRSYIRQRNEINQTYDY